MDGSFVQNFALNFWQIDSIRKATKLPLHVHLMAYEPARYLHRLSESGVNTIVFSCRGLQNPDYALREIKDHGINAGVALNVETPMTILLIAWIWWMKSFSWQQDQGHGPEIPS